MGKIKTIFTSLVVVIAMLGTLMPVRMVFAVSAIEVGDGDSLATAINSVTNGGEAIITLTNAITLSTHVVVSAGAKVTLNLNGNTLSLKNTDPDWLIRTVGAVNGISAGTLIINAGEGGKITNDGVGNVASNTYGLIRNGGILTLNGGIYEDIGATNNALLRNDGARHNDTALVNGTIIIEGAEMIAKGTNSVITTGSASLATNKFIQPALIKDTTITAVNNVWPAVRMVDGVGLTLDNVTLNSKENGLTVMGTDLSRVSYLQIRGGSYVSSDAVAIELLDMFRTSSNGMYSFEMDGNVRAKGRKEAIVVSGKEEFYRQDFRITGGAFTSGFYVDTSANVVPYDTVRFQQKASLIAEVVPLVYKELISGGKYSINPVEYVASGKKAYNYEDAELDTHYLVADEVTGLTVAPEMIELKKGETAEVTTMLMPETASMLVTYESGNTGIATIDENGRITGVSIGETTVTVAPIYDASLAKVVEVKVMPILLEHEYNTENGSIRFPDELEYELAEPVYLVIERMADENIPELAQEKENLLGVYNVRLVRQNSGEDEAIQLDVDFEVVINADTDVFTAEDEDYEVYFVGETALEEVGATTCNLGTGTVGFKVKHTSPYAIYAVRNTQQNTGGIGGFDNFDENGFDVGAIIVSGLGMGGIQQASHLGVPDTGLGATMVGNGISSKKMSSNIDMDISGIVTMIVIIVTSLILVSWRDVVRRKVF